MKFFPGPFLRNCCLKIRHFSIKIFWPLKNIWRTLSDVKSNFWQLSFSTLYWFFHSLRSYWALKKQDFGSKYFSPNIFLKTLKLNNSSRIEKINIVKKTKVAWNSNLHQIFFRGQNIFHTAMSNFQTAISQKGPRKKFQFFF